MQSIWRKRRKDEEERRRQIILKADEFKKREREKIANIEKRKGKKPGNVVVQAPKPAKLTDKAWMTLLLNLKTPPLTCKMPSSPPRWADGTLVKHLRDQGLQTKGADEEVPNLKHTHPPHVEPPTPPAAAAKDRAMDLACMLVDEDAKPEVRPFSLLEYITNEFSSELKIGNGGYGEVYKGMPVKRLPPDAYVYTSQTGKSGEGPKVREEVTPQFGDDCLREKKSREEMQ